MGGPYAHQLSRATEEIPTVPELPEVEIASRNLGRWSVGRRIAGLETPDQARFEGEARALVGREVLSWSRRGKYLVARLSEGWALLSHLGMTGQWVVDPDPSRAHQRVVMELAGAGPRRVVLVDPRRFGWTWVLRAEELDRHPRLLGLGPDPLDPSFDLGTLRRAVGSSRSPLKTRLMDQRVVAGLGNIAISEIGWRAQIHLHRKAASLSEEEWTRLHASIGEHLHWVLDQEEDEEIAYLGTAGALNPFYCYGRMGEPCGRCGAPLQRSVLSGRATFSCPSCQGP